MEQPTSHRDRLRLGLTCVALVLAVGCTSTPAPNPAGPGDDAAAPDPRGGLPPNHELSFGRTSRRWASAELFQNRLQDWALEDGQLVCVERRPSFPLRTAMLLTASADASRPLHAMLELSAPDGTGRRIDGPHFDATSQDVVPGVASPDPSPRAGFRGLVLGAGGAHVDPRLSALVHHRPALDGGLLAVVDEAGSVALYDNGAPTSASGGWSLGGPLADGELPRIAAARAVHPVSPGSPIALQVDVGPADAAGFCTLSIASQSQTSARTVARLEHSLPRAALAGALGLVSHLGPRDPQQSWRFDHVTLIGDGLVERPERALGPMVGSHFTTGAHGLTLNVQLMPLGADDPGFVELRVPDAGDPGGWITRARAPVDRDSWTARFRVPDWDTSASVPYVLAAASLEDSVPAGRPHSLTSKGAFRHQELRGTIPAEPSPDESFVIASLNCQKIYTGGLQWNHDGLWFPHAEVARDVAAHDPDLLFFAGDQIYEGDLDPVDARDEDTLILDYLYKYIRHCWSFGELTRDIPSIVIPDDHDVYHGNLWGAGGRAAVADKARGLSAQDAGGYKFGPRFVNVVHATQTGHLPDPVDPTPVEQGISVYTTRLDTGGVSFAVLADRQWKSSASVMVPEGQVVNGWFQAEGFDPRDADVPGAVLLGERQLAFLDDWAADWSDGTWMKVALSQTPFVNVATIPEEAAGGGVLPSLPIPEPDAYPEGYEFAADTDSGGWPQSGRDAAVRALRKGFAVHLAGDQHLGSLVEYGLDTHRDGGFAFTAPAVANTWPRRWWPPIHGGDPEPGAPHYTGDFTDGFGNLLTVWAVANPVQSGREPRNLHDRMPGYGIVRLHPRTRSIDLECWPRDVDPTADDARQYAGWPRRVAQLDNHGAPVGWLAPVHVPDNATPVLRLVDEASGETVYALRAPRDGFRPPVYGSGPFTLEFGEPDSDAWWRVQGLQATDDDGAPITPPREEP